MKLDLNSDIGEGFAYDAEIIKLVDSVNIACGGHAGNISLMNETVELAKQAGIHIGAHPGYPDKENFGRVDMNMTPTEIYDEVSKQVKVLFDICDKHNTKLHHVKPHGQLYNKAAKDKATAQARALSESTIAQKKQELDAKMVEFHKELATEQENLKKELLSHIGEYKQSIQAKLQQV